MNQILADAFERIRQGSHRAVDGLDTEALAYRPDQDANSIGWLVWHLTRVQDHHISELAGRDQTWIVDDWAQRFGLDPDPENVGYGHTSSQVAALRPAGANVLIEYHDATCERTLEYTASVRPEHLDRIVDRRWDPPVSAGVRLVSVINDCLQHVGQAHYVRGLYERLG